MPTLLPNFYIQKMKKFYVPFTLCVLCVTSHECFADVQGPQVRQSDIPIIQEKATSGDADAQAMLGIIYVHGWGTSKDEVKALEWFQKSAQQGNRIAESDLGNLYSEGRGVPKDKAQAAQWWEKAADQNDAKAQHSLCKAYALGAGVARDDTKSFEWCQRAAEQGYVRAQAHIAIMYLKGLGVPEDLVQAYKWMSLSAAGHDPEAMSALAELEKSMTLEQVTEGKTLASAWKPTPETTPP